MDDSAEVKLVDEITGEGGAAGDWGYLGSDGMDPGSYPAFPFPCRDVTPTVACYTHPARTIPPNLLLSPPRKCRVRPKPLASKPRSPNCSI